jgi:hypothetical protein
MVGYPLGRGCYAPRSQFASAIDSSQRSSTVEFIESVQLPPATRRPGDPGNGLRRGDVVIPIEFGGIDIVEAEQLGQDYLLEVLGEATAPARVIGLCGHVA